MENSIEGSGNSLAFSKPKGIIGKDSNETGRAFRFPFDRRPITTAGHRINARERCTCRELRGRSGQVTQPGGPMHTSASSCITHARARLHHDNNFRVCTRRTCAFILGHPFYLEFRSATTCFRVPFSFPFVHAPPIFLSIMEIWIRGRNRMIEWFE